MGPIILLGIVIIIISIIAIVCVIIYMTFEKTMDMFNDVYSIIGDQIVIPLSEKFIDAMLMIGSMGKEIALKVYRGISDLLINKLVQLLLKVLEKLDVSNLFYFLYNAMMDRARKGFKNALFVAMDIKDFFEGIINGMVNTFKNFEFFDTGTIPHPPPVPPSVPPINEWPPEMQYELSAYITNNVYGYMNYHINKGVKKLPLKQRWEIRMARPYFINEDANTKLRMIDAITQNLNKRDNIQ